MKKIELLGPSGVGKSTLLLALESQASRVEGLPLFSRTAAVKLACAAYEKSRNLSIPLKVILSLPLLRSGIRMRLKHEAETMAFPDFAHAYQGLLATAANGFCIGDQSEYMRAEGYYHFLSTIRECAFLEHWQAKSGRVLLDEWTSQKVYTVIPWDHRYTDLAREYFRHSPCPQLLILLHADVSTIIERIRIREHATGKIIPAHRQISPEQLTERVEVSLEFARIGAEILATRGTQILRLDARLPVSENLPAVIEAIQQT